MSHQTTGAKRLDGLRVGGLFMDMGTGKTLTAFELVARRAERIDRVVWFTPVSLLMTLAAELRKHLLDPRLYLFDQRTTQSTLPYDQDWYGVGIESMSASDRLYFAANDLIDDRTCVIVDESSYIKTHNAERTKRITNMAQRARYRFILTGTPISQGVIDLYAQMRFLSHKILGFRSFYGFARNHLEYSEKFPGLIVRTFGTEQVAEKIAPYIYQVTKEQCLDLPEKQHIHSTCDMTEDQEQAYGLAKFEILERIDAVEPWMTSYIIFQLFSALQKIACGFQSHRGEWTDLANWRIDLLESTIRSINPDEPVLIWTKYHYCLQEICSMLKKAFQRDGIVPYHGKLSTVERAAAIKQWRNNGRFLVATPGVGGHGLTLTEARYAIFYDSQFKYSEHIQAEDRIHRIGQTRSVTYVSLWTQCSIEDRIHAALATKGSAVADFRRELEETKDVKRLIEEL